MHRWRLTLKCSTPRDAHTLTIGGTHTHTPAHFSATSHRVRRNFRPTPLAFEWCRQGPEGEGDFPRDTQPISDRIRMWTLTDTLLFMGSECLQGHPTST